MTERSVQHANFTIERTFDVSPERVFHAWSDEGARIRWFTEGEGFKRAEYIHNFRVGGRESSTFKIEIMGKLSQFRNDTTYFDIVDNTRIVFAYSMARDGVVFSVSLATVELHADGKGTRLVFTEQAAFFDDADGPQMREQGWSSLLNSFGKEIARAA
ncbi:MAG: SRPBCC family protein [Alphaproteobacteria bacterium]